MTLFGMLPVFVRLSELSAAPNAFPVDHESILTATPVDQRVHRQLEVHAEIFAAGACTSKSAVVVAVHTGVQRLELLPALHTPKALLFREGSTVVGSTAVEL